jgi:hypothetical protein
MEFFMEFHGQILWKNPSNVFVEFHGFPRKTPWNFVEFHGIQWNWNSLEFSMEFFMEFSGNP